MSRDILAALEAQLEGLCSSDEEDNDDSDDDDDSEEYTSSDDGDDDDDDSSSDDDSDQDNSEEDDSKEEDSSAGEDEESAVTSPSQAQQRLHQTRTDASHELQEELERIHSPQNSTGADRKPAQPRIPQPSQQQVRQQQKPQSHQEAVQSHLTNSRNRLQAQLEEDSDEEEEPSALPGGKSKRKQPSKPLPRREESMDASARLHEVEASFARTKEAAQQDKGEALPVTLDKPRAPTRTTSGQLLMEEYERKTEEDKARAAIQSLKERKSNQSKTKLKKANVKTTQQQKQQQQTEDEGDDDSLSDVTDSAHDLGMFDDVSENSSSSSSSESSSASSLSSATKKNAEELKISVTVQKQLAEREHMRKLFRNVTGESLGENSGDNPPKEDHMDTGGPPPLKSMPRPSISRPAPAARTKPLSSFKSNHSRSSVTKGNVGALIAGMNVQPQQVVEKPKAQAPPVTSLKSVPQPIPVEPPVVKQESVVAQPEDKVENAATYQDAVFSSTAVLPSFPTDGDSNGSMTSTLNSFQLDSDAGNDNNDDSSSHISHMSSPLLSSVHNLSKPYHHGRGPFGPNKMPLPPAAAKDKHKRHRPSQAQTIAIVLYVCLGSIVALRLYCLAGYRSLARAKQPHLMFDHHAREALTTVSRRLQDIATSLQDLAVDLQETARDTNQLWPTVTFANLQDLIPNHFEITTAGTFPDVIIAPMVTPRRWKKFEKYRQQQQEEKESCTSRQTLLGWDEVYGEPVEPLFVPWQKYSPTISSKAEDRDDTLVDILQDWYVDNPPYETAWDTLTSQAKNKGTSEMNPFLLLRSSKSESTRNSDIGGYDYIIQPLIATRDSGKKGRFRLGHAERSVVAVVAVQVKISILLSEAAREAFSFLEASDISVMAHLEDPCLGSTADFKISAGPLFGSTPIISAPNSNNLRQDVSQMTSLVEGFLSNGEVDSADDAGFSRCLYGSSGIELRLNPTSTLMEALRPSLDWSYLQILATWLLLYTFVAYAAYFGNLEKRRLRQMRNEQRETARALEEIDPFDAFSSATVAVMDIAGWDDWVNEAGRAPSEVQSFLTSLLHAMDGVATKHDVVKIQMVGCSLVYGVGGKDHALCVADFVRECYVRMPRWVDHFASAYGPKTRDLEFVCGFDSGSLMDGHVLANMTTSQVSGSAIRTAATLVSICENGRVLISKNSANMLTKLKRGGWVLSRDAITIGEELFWLDTSKESYEKQMTSSSRHASARLKDSKHNSRKSFTSIGIVGKANSATNSRASLRSGGTLSRRGRNSVNSIQSLFDDEENLPTLANIQARNSRDSPPPLTEMEERPPIEQINVHQDQVQGVPSAPDLGYETIEPRKFEQEEGSESGSQEHKEIETEEKRERLIEWSVDVLTRCLEEVLAARTTSHSKKALAGLEDQLGKGSNILEQCKECIAIPIFSKSELRERAHPGSVKLTNAAATQLRDYVTKIAHHYHDETNIFHSFEHAANVTASMRKLFNKLAGNDFGKRRGSDKSLSGLKSMMKDNSGRSLFSSIGLGESTSFGITTDPLIKFSMLFCALIHDVDHPGISNAILVAQKSPMAAVYKKRSIAEQNSVDFSWTLLMRPEYVDLRAAIYSDEKELQRFRQVIVNCVLATDLDDAELQMTRKARWAKAFSDDGVTAGTIQPRRKKPMRRNNKSTDGVIRKGRAQPKPTASGGGMLAALRKAASEASKGIMTRPKDNLNRKGTIVLEHLLQAANISHCMQNWKVYLKWNERLFDENYEAYEADRIKEDPAAKWYQGELDFFDTTVIPLAKKLVSCGILGDAAEELLENAFLNKDEWEVQGHEIMKIYLEHYQEAHIHHPRLSQSDLLTEGAVELSDGVLSLPQLKSDTSDAENIGASEVSNQTSAHQATQAVLELDEPKARNTGNTAVSDPKCTQTVVTEEITEVSGAAPLLIPGTANSSVAGTISYDGTGSDAGDPDVVFAILENPDAPDDFDSYILITPTQKRQREAKAAEKEGATPAGRRRRALRTRSSNGGMTAPANAFKRSNTTGSNHTRKSLGSLSSAISADSFSS